MYIYVCMYVCTYVMQGCGAAGYQTRPSRRGVRGCGWVWGDGGGAEFRCGAGRRRGGGAPRRTGENARGEGGRSCKSSGEARSGERAGRGSCPVFQCSRGRWWRRAGGRSGGPSKPKAERGSEGGGAGDAPKRWTAAERRVRVLQVANAAADERVLSECGVERVCDAVV